MLTFNKNHITSKNMFVPSSERNSKVTKCRKYSLNRTPYKWQTYSVKLNYVSLHGRSILRQAMAGLTTPLTPNESHKLLSRSHSRLPAQRSKITLSPLWLHIICKQIKRHEENKQTTDMITKINIFELYNPKP